LTQVNFGIIKIISSPYALEIYQLFVDNKI
jgi:hypothetical protein